MQSIVIYADEGVSGDSLKHLMRSLQQEVDLEKCSLVRMDAKRILNESWEKESSLLIIPGGRDVFYHASLDGAGTDKISHFVQKGGSYLGICAGAYFACSAIEFEKGGTFEICAPRSLKLFPGIAKGSAYGLNKYSYENYQGAEAAKISWGIEECHTYFNGGCTFEADEHYPWIKPLSHYLDLPNTPASILEIEVGKGRAILSGVHFEYIPRLLNRDEADLSKIIPLLEQADSLRRAIFRSCLKKLGISLV